MVDVNIVHNTVVNIIASFCYLGFEINFKKYLPDEGNYYNTGYVTYSFLLYDWSRFRNKNGVAEWSSRAQKHYLKMQVFKVFCREGNKGTWTLPGLLHCNELVQTLKFAGLDLVERVGKLWIQLPSTILRSPSNTSKTWLVAGI